VKVREDADRVFSRINEADQPFSAVMFLLGCPQGAVMLSPPHTVLAEDVDAALSVACARLQAQLLLENG